MAAEGLVFQLYLSTLATNRVKRQYTPLGGFEATPQQKKMLLPSYITTLQR